MQRFTIRQQEQGDNREEQDHDIPSIDIRHVTKLILFLLYCNAWLGDNVLIDCYWC